MPLKMLFGFKQFFLQTFQINPCFWMFAKFAWLLDLWPHVFCVRETKFEGFYRFFDICSTCLSFSRISNDFLNLEH